MKTRSHAAILSYILCGGLAAASQLPAQQETSQAVVAPKITGIAHVAIRVSDVAASRAFYEKLGFTQPFELKDKDGNTTESFVKLNDRQFIELYPSDAGHTPGFQHVCFEAVNLTGLHDIYAANGLVTPAVRKAGAGNMLIAWKGPEGQMEEITEYMPGSRHSNDFGKDLGPNRISEKLVAAIVPMQDPKAAADFFVSKMGFVNDKTQDEALVVSPPGVDAAYFGFLPSTSPEKLVMVFEVQSSKNADAELKSRGLHSTKHDGRLIVADPDGNLIVFAPEHGKDLLKGR